MKIINGLSLTVLLSAVIGVSGCGGSSSRPASNPPAPAISSLSPSSATAGGAAFTLTVNGSNFVSASEVQWNGSARTTSYVSAAIITAQISAADIAAAGSANISVFSPGADGGTSSAVKLAINAAPAQGSLSITIMGLPAGSAASVAVTGPNGYNTQLISSQTLQVAPGAYSVVGNSVAVGNSTYYPATATQTATVSNAATASLTVNYSTIIPTTTKVLDAAGMDSLTVSPDGSTITISTSSAVASSLAVGDVLASAPTTAAPNGLLVKILSVGTSGQTVTASVQQATLEEAIQQGAIRFTETLGPGNTTPHTRARKAAHSRQTLHRFSRAASTGGACGGNSNTIQLPFDVSLAGQAGGASTSLDLTGESDFCPSFNFTLQIKSFHVVSANANVTAGLHTEINLIDSGALTISGSQNLATFAATPTVAFIGPVPITVRPTLTPFVGASGSSATFSTGTTTDSTVAAGVSYANGAWNPVDTATSPTATSSTTSVDGQASLKGFVGLQAGVILDGVVTPSLSTDAYLQFNASLTGNPCWTLGAGLEANVGVNVSFLSVNLTNYTSPTLNLYSATVAQATNTCFAPVLNSITPNMALGMSPQITIALAGSNFVSDSTASFNGQQLSTTFVDANDLTAIVPASDLATAGVFPVTVNNPDSPGGTSAPVNFTVGNVTVSVSPMTAAVPVGKSQQFTATVEGSSNSGVFWSVNGTIGGNTTVGTISSDGLYSAPATVPNPAIVSVTAKSQAESSISASANVTVTTLNYIFTTVDDPSGSSINGTQPWGINATGQIVGAYYDNNSNEHGFLYSDGNFTTIDYPNSGTSSADIISTKLAGINGSGQILGSHEETDKNNNYIVDLDFLYSGGSFTTINLPSAALVANGIDDSSQIVGIDTSASGEHGYLYSDGNLTLLDDPNAADGTEAWGINNSGQIVGAYFDSNSNEHGFLYSNGQFTTIDDPLSISGCTCVAHGINNNGQIVGEYTDSAANDTGFLYSNGIFTTIDYPGSFPGSSWITGINDSGQIVGFYSDSNGKQHGFLATPSQ